MDSKRMRLIVVGLTALVIAVLFRPGLSMSGQSLTESDVYREIAYLPDEGRREDWVYHITPKKEGRYPVLLDLRSVRERRSRLGRSRQGLPGAWLCHRRCQRAWRGVLRGGLQPVRSARGGGWGGDHRHLGAQAWSTGAVGMVGNSYPGHTQILTGAHRPKYLKALAAGGLTSSIYREAFRPGGIMNVGFASRWSFLGQPRSSRRPLKRESDGGYGV